MSQQTFGMVPHNTDQNQNQQMGDSIDPSELSMQNGNYSLPYTNSQLGLSSSYNFGSSGIHDDELIDLDFDHQQNTMQGFSSGHHNQNIQYPDQRHPSGISMNHGANMNNTYSSTPDSAPIQSPFLGGFDYGQFRPTSIPPHMSSHQQTQFPHGFQGAGLPRRTSAQRSPLTPKTAAVAGINGLSLNTPDSAVLNSQPIKASSMSRGHHKALSNQWDSTSGSLHSYVDSPISSPGHPSHHGHNQISEMLRTGKGASLPAKVENGKMETGDDKRKRRRASHNQVERRRRDNINERIQDLSHLVPGHRLDDDRVKKSLQNNTPLSPMAGPASASPPNAATSLLAGAQGRRAASTAGNITLGLPIEDKEKGPNKGDILNGSVAWTRDLMWALHQKYLQEDELQQNMSQSGIPWPFEITEDERRMRSEIMAIMDKQTDDFGYSRSHGSGLRVPGYTNHAGERLQKVGTEPVSPQSNFQLSPAFHPGGSGTTSDSGGPGQPQYWIEGQHPGMSFKEEDEFMVD